jgi:hypothetical protein
MDRRESRRLGAQHPAEDASVGGVTPPDLMLGPVPPGLGELGSGQDAGGQPVVSVVGRRHQPDRDTVPWPVGHLDPVTGADLSLLQDGQVRTRPSGCGEPAGKARIAHPDAELPARHPG